MLSTTMLFPVLFSLLGSAAAAPMPKSDNVQRPGWRGHTHHRRDDVDHKLNPAPTITAPKTNPWVYLSNDEAAGVIGYLHGQPDLNLTSVEEAGSWDNTIMVVDLHAPPKQETLAYLDKGGPVPDRYAVASLMFGATGEPCIQDYLIGPLPVSNTTTHSPLQHNGGDKIRVYDMDDSYGFYIRNAMEMKDIVSDLLDAKIETEEDLTSTFALWGIDPLWHEDGRVISWVQFWRRPTNGFDAQTLLPQGLYLKLDITGRDESEWKLKGIFYGDEFYKSIKDFRKAWEKKKLPQLKPNIDTDGYTSTDHVGEPYPLEHLPPPKSVQTQQRFSVDEEQKYVEWNGFSFYVTFTRDTGMKIYDVKFQGERVLYELGLEEAIAHYAGNDPTQSGTSYADTYYGFGVFALSMVPGFDMPTHAYCMASAFHASEISKKHRCGIAIFESDQGYVMQRHTTSEYVSATKNIALTLRSVTTVGNYDYTFDYVFYLDGSIEVLVRASGYIQSAYWFHNEEFGYKIHDNLSGSMHDHVLTFKADFDIAGTENTLVKHSFEPVTKKFKWSKKPRKTMHIARSEITNEKDGKQNWGANGKDQVMVVNKDAKNKFGEERGYKIMPSKGGGMHMTIQESPNLLKSAAFATHSYYVTKTKDEEARAISAWNAFDPGHPLVDFDKFFDGEDIEQEDISVWFNLGMHHVPHTGDLPNTVMTTAQSGMILTPHNMFLNDPSRRATNQIRINYGPDNVTEVNTFGSTLDDAWDPLSYLGDVAVRKFPYDPLNPFNDTESI